jgi:hypothetical protein
MHDVLPPFFLFIEIWEGSLFIYMSSRSATKIKYCRKFIGRANTTSSQPTGTQQSVLHGNMSKPRGNFETFATDASKIKALGDFCEITSARDIASLSRSFENMTLGYATCGTAVLLRDTLKSATQTGEEQQWWITVRLDGLPCKLMLVICEGQPKAIMIMFDGTACKYYELSVYAASKYFTKGTLVSGELVVSRTDSTVAPVKLILLVDDAIYVCGDAVHDNPFEQRTMLVEDLFTLRGKDEHEIGLKASEGDNDALVDLIRSKIDSNDKIIATRNPHHLSLCGKSHVPFTAHGMDRLASLTPPGVRQIGMDFRVVLSEAPYTTLARYKWDERNMVNIRLHQKDGPGKSSGCDYENTDFFPVIKGDGGAGEFLPANSHPSIAAQCELVVANEHNYFIETITSRSDDVYECYIRQVSGGTGNCYSLFVTRRAQTASSVEDVVAAVVATKEPITVFDLYECSVKTHHEPTLQSKLCTDHLSTTTI